jgi:hypothetical protein
VAREFKDEVKIGKDGKPWVSIPNKNMSYSWQPYGGTAHDKYIEKAARAGDIASIKNLDVEIISPSNSVPDAGTETPKKTDKKGVPNSSDPNKVKVSKPKTSTPNTSTPKYTKKTDKSGRVMYYNITGKRTAKKNVPEEYL